MMKIISNTLKFFFIVTGFMNVALAQQEATVLLIKADSGWSKEVFYFPISFVPELKYVGYEEARFPRGWAKKDSASFWSYVFAWKIEAKTALTEKELEGNLTLYFDGLIRTQKPAESNFPKTIAFFVQQNTANNRQFFNGKVRIFDAFTTQAPLLLHVTVEQNFCEAKQEAILLFRFSPKISGHPIWNRLNGLAIAESVFKDNKCN